MKKRIMSKRITLLFALLCVMYTTQAQTSINLRGGFLAKSASVTQYGLPGGGFLFDDGNYDDQMATYMFGLDINIPLNDRFTFVQGFNLTEQGFSSISFTNSAGISEGFDARQNALGLSTQLQYNFKDRDSDINYYIAMGTLLNTPIGDPSEASLNDGENAAKFALASNFGSTNLSILARIGASKSFGAGRIFIEATIVNGLSDMLNTNNVFIAKEFGIGASIGYQIAF